MAKDKQEAKKNLARLREQFEADIPRLTRISAAVIGALESTDAEAHEVVTVCLDLSLQALGRIFGEMNAAIVAEGISQILKQLNDDPDEKELFKQTERRERLN
jgi:hypothetical protein